MPALSIRHPGFTLTLTLGGLCVILGSVAAWLALDRHWPVLPPTFKEESPAVGVAAPDFTLRDLDGREFRLADQLGRKPLVIEFGSVTSLHCVLGQFDRKEALAREFASQADFVFVYCREAHPDVPYGSRQGANPPQTFTWQERAERARSFRSKLHVGRRILIDGDGDESVQAQYGGRDNMLVVIDADGRIAFKQPVADHRELRRFLDEMPAAE